ncbi:MAG: DUF1772 domain-containing protein [Candidatus Binatia bacterium]
MGSIWQFLAVLSCTLFTGAAIYINAVEHPARMSCGTELAATVFGPSYKRAAIMQVILAVIATLAGIGAWLTEGRGLWLVGTLLIFAVIPFTLVAIMPTNKQLLDARLDRGSETARELLQRWGQLHAARSVLSLVASCVFLSLVTGR